MIIIIIILITIITIVKIIIIINSTTSVIKNLAKICGKLISKKLVLGEAAQLKSIYLHKGTENQSAWDCRINLKFYENAF